MHHATINRIYRLVWNAALGAWVAVAENCKGRSKDGSPRRAVLALASLLALAHPVLHAAEAANAAVSAGTGSVSTSGAVTTIDQSSQRLAIDWSKLSTAANEALVFKQPNAASIALNRVTGSEPSQLLGSLSANGQVFILNPNGVLFGASSQVNVGGLVASTLSLSNDDFMAGKYSFANGGSSGSVVNQGNITAAQGGYVALLAPQARNEGVITARLGNALLAAGNKVTLNLDNGSLVGYSIDQGAVNALAENRQLIQADGGQVVMTARALDALTTATVNNTGVIEAQTVDSKTGRILLLGDMHNGTTNVAGTLDASAPNGGDGGFIETSAFRVKTDESAKITTRAPYGKTGSLLIDPDTFLVNNAGADSGTSGTNSFYSNTYLSALLEISSVTIATTGGTNIIAVNGAVSWDSNSTLALQTSGDLSGIPGSISINAPVTFNSGTLDLFTLGTISVPAALQGNILSQRDGSWVTVNATLPTLQVRDFQFANNRFFSGSFIRALGGNGTAGNPYQLTDIYGVQGMVGDTAGNYYTLANNIDAGATRNWYASAGFQPTVYHAFKGHFDGQGHTISNITVNRPTEDYIGMFSSIASGASVGNVGIVNASITGDNYVGGLAGYNQGAISGSSITGSVRSTDGVAQQIGGMVGDNAGGSISNSYSTASVSGAGDAGGLVGLNTGSITNTYATGSVYGNGYNVGGLVGDNQGSISTSYSTGAVTGFASLGGLVGATVIAPGVSVTNSYWDTQKSGRATSAGGTGKTTAQMQTASTFATWSLSTTGDPATSTVWRIYEGHTAPLLRSFLTPAALTSSSTVYDGTAQSAATPPSSSNVFGIAATGTNAGTYTSDYWSNQQGYDIRNNTLTITPRPLDITGSRTYDGTTVFNSGDLTLGNLVGSQTLVLSGSGSVGSADASSTAQVLGNTGGLAISDGANGGLASNYALFAAGSTSQATIGQRVLTLSGGRTYDGTTLVSASGLTLGNLVGSQTLNLSGSATIDTKNAGTHTTVGTGGLTLANGTGGGKAGNYTLAGGADSLVIGQRTLNVTATGIDKVYDATTTAAVTLGSDKVAGDKLTLSYALGTFASKNVGTRAIAVSGIGVSGDDAANYTLAGTTASASADITARTLNVTASGLNKVYDGNTTAGATLGSDQVAGDRLTLSYTLASFDNKNAGTRAISVSGVSVSGDDAANYVLAASTLSTSASITPRPLTVTANNEQKAFDGLHYSGGNGVTYSGFVAGDSASDIGGVLSYGGSSQGAYLMGTYAITPAGLTSLSGNYAPVFANGTLTISAAVPYLDFQGLPALMNVYDCSLQAVAGLDGAHARRSAGCMSSSGAAAMAARLADAAADSAP